MDYSDESYDESMPTEILEDIRDGSQSHPNLNRREARYKICDCIEKKQSKWKGALKDMQNMGKGLHKVLKTVFKDILQYLLPLGEYGSEISHFIPEPRNFSEVKKLSVDINKPWLKATQKNIKI